MAGPLAPDLSDIAPITQQPLKVQIADRLRQAIVSGRLKPGTPLVETVLADQMNVSRAPIREAIQILENDGLVETVAYKNKRVKPVTAREVSEIYSLREVFEVMAVRRILDSGADVGSLRDPCEAMAAAARSGSRARLAAADESFHHRLIELADHTLLLQSWTSLYLRIHQIMALRTRREKMDLDRVAANHPPIVDAIESGDRRAEPQADRRTYPRAGRIRPRRHRGGAGRMIRSVLITGAGGFVAGHIAAGIAATGRRVVAIDRTFDAAAREQLAECELVVTDLDDGGVDLTGIDLAIHGAAVTSSTGLTEAAHVAANLDPLRAFLVAVERDRPGGFVFLSSSGVFSPGDGGETLQEGDLPTVRGAYAEAKRAGEQLTLCGQFGASAMHAVRLGHIFGPDERPRPTRARVSIDRPLDRRGRGRARAGGGGGRSGAGLDLGAGFRAGAAPACRRGPRRPGAAPGERRGAARQRKLAARIAAAAGVEVTEVPAAQTKPPMAPSAIAALDGFAWTAPEAGIDRLLAAKVPA